MWRRAVLSSSTTPQLLLRKLSPPSSATTPPHSQTLFSAPLSGNTLKKDEDVMPIATGHEREEPEAALKDSPAIVKSESDKRIVGCPGGEGSDEHDFVWFWLEKGKPRECPVCSQYIKLEVVGPGGLSDGHGDCCLCLQLEVAGLGGPPDGHGDDHHH